MNPRSDRRNFDDVGGRTEGGKWDIPKVVGIGRNFPNIAEYFAIEKAQRGRNHNGRGGDWEYKV